MAERPSEPSGPEYRAPAAACAAKILKLLARVSGPLSLAEIVRASGQSKSLVFRVVAELTREGLVETRSDGGYTLGFQVLELGAAYAGMNEFGMAASRQLRELSEQSGQTVNLGVLRGMEIVYLLKYPGPSSYVTISHVGGRVPANCVALGKALLAELSDEQLAKRIAVGPLPRMTPYSLTDRDELRRDIERVRLVGHAVDRDQAVQGRSGLAIALSSTAGETVGISISIDSALFEKQATGLLRQLTEVRDRLRDQIAARQALGEPVNIVAVTP
jgi:DNA-binding IclR family transcriptional regulator